MVSTIKPPESHQTVRQHNYRLNILRQINQVITPACRRMWLRQPRRTSTAGTYDRRLAWFSDRLPSGVSGDGTAAPLQAVNFRWMSFTVAAAGRAGVPGEPAERRETDQPLTPFENFLSGKKCCLLVYAEGGC
jgi:hypothetical protein